MLIVRTSLLVICLFALCFASTKAASHRILREDIRTLRTDVAGQIETLPIVRLGSTDVVEISFDQLSHDGKMFFYRVEHWDRAFERPTSGLFTGEFLESNYEDVPIEDHRESRNTSVLYTHYAFQFPGADARPLVSGNYKLKIYDRADPDGNPVAEVCLCVVEPLLNVSGRVLTNTEVDWNDRNQQVELQAQALSQLPTADLRLALQATVRQNGRSDNQCELLPPTVVLPGRIARWEHTQKLIFPAGNVYRSFEQLNMRVAGSRVENLNWHSPYYHATLFPDEVRRNFILREDRNGTAVIRNTDNRDNATESDYMFVHFVLESDEIPDAEVYVSGRWTTGGLLPEYRMTYRPERRAYETALLLKQGYYNYIYLTVPAQQTKQASFRRTGLTAPTEGDFYETRNTYTAYIYGTFPSDRYDRLVGVVTIGR